MYKLDLEKIEGTETKLPTPLDPRKNKGIQKKKKRDIYYCSIDCAKAFDCVDHNKLENS